ncbi:MAG TPA: uracil-DNA glycosylase family protein [Acetobacteraceae bacterium]|nr:uracil-DNA glycosylase family protein [Acetobacteraceae bacterium]
MDDYALLTLQIAWGADEALDDAPVDRLRTAAPVRPAPAHSVPPAPARPLQARPPAAAPGLPSQTTAERAVAAAGSANSIEALASAIAGFDGCVLRDTATRAVLPQGDAASGLLLIGDPPGADEDRSGQPFAGEDGALLDRMLASVGLDRAGLLMAPLIPWRPPGGRPPSAGELAICLPFLHRLIVLAEPRQILLLGPLAVRMLLDGKRRRPGSGWTTLSLPGLPTPVPALVLPTPHMVRSTPSVRRDAWTELRRLRRALDGGIAEL